MSGSSKPVRVTLVGPSLDILGGQAVQAQRLLERFHQTAGLNADFLAVNPRLPGPLGLMQRVKYLRTIATSVAYAGSLLRRLPRTQVVHAFSASYWSFLLAPVPAMLVGRLYRKQVVLNYRSGEAEDHLRRSRVVLPLMRMAHQIVVPSGYLVEVFSRFGLRAVAIPNFVDTTAIRFRSRSTPGPRFLGNRNFEAHYNLPATVRAFARIQAAVPEAELTLVGQGQGREALQQLVKDLGLRAVTFAGAVPPEQMPAYYDRSDIYLNSPDLDNMPTSIIEAFAAGLPVVSTRAGGIPWIVRHDENGLLVDCNDDAALAAGALRVLREPGLATRLTNSALTDVKDRYTWEAVEPQWLSLYGNLVRRESTHP